jgi:uncharacterized protein (TIGR00369 family)
MDADPDDEDPETDRPGTAETVPGPSRDGAGPSKGAERDPGGLTLPPGTPVGPLGFVLRLVEPGHSIWEYRVDPAHFNPNGALHGGVVMALLDTAMGFAVAARMLPEGRFNAAAEMSTRFLAPVRAGTLRAEATLLKAGKRLAVVEARATDDQGVLVAIATATHALLP